MNNANTETQLKYALGLLAQAAKKQPDILDKLLKLMRHKRGSQA